MILHWFLCTSAWTHNLLTACVVFLTTEEKQDQQLREAFCPNFRSPLFISKPVSPSCPAFDWPQTFWFSGLYRPDPNHMGWEQESLRQRSLLDPQLWVLSYLRSLVRSTFSGAETSFGVTRPEELFDLPMRKLTWVWKHCWAKQCAPVRGFSAFGPLGRGLLRFLSSACSHSRWAGFSLSAPFCHCRHRRRRRLAPRPTGNTRSNCQSVSVAFKRRKELVNVYFTRKWLCSSGSITEKEKPPWIPNPNSGSWWTFWEWWACFASS